MINWAKAEPLIHKGLSDKEIAEEVGCHFQSIKQHRLKMGLTHSRNLDYEVVDVIIYINESDDEVADLVGCSPSTIALRRRKLGIKKLYREYASGRKGKPYYPDTVNEIISKLKTEYGIKGDFEEWKKTHKMDIEKFLGRKQ